MEKKDLKELFGEGVIYSYEDKDGELIDERYEHNYLFNLKD